MTTGASRLRWRPEHLHALPVERARSRVSAYVYGNILVLAAVATSTPSTIRNGHAVVYVLATTLTTYLAHVLAHDVAAAIGRDPADHARHRRQELRDAVPILSSGSIPAVVLLVGALTDRRSGLVVLVAAAVVVVRLAAMGPLVSRLGGQGTARTAATWSGLGLALLSTGIVALKVWLLH